MPMHLLVSLPMETCFVQFGSILSKQVDILDLPLTVTCKPFCCTRPADLRPNHQLLRV